MKTLYFSKFDESYYWEVEIPAWFGFRNPNTCLLSFEYYRDGKKVSFCLLPFRQWWYMNEVWDNVRRVGIGVGIFSFFVDIDG